MRITRIIAFGVILASAGLSGLHAQSLRKSEPPAEFPAASYKGKQYVDSRGCIYIRAGIDGNVTWIPRVNRARKQVCGYKPTVTAKGGAPAPQGKAPVIITAGPAPKASAKPTVQPTAKPAAKQAVVAKPKAPTVRAAAPRAAAPAKPSGKPAPTVFANPVPKAKPAAKPTAVVRTQPTTTARATSRPTSGPSSAPAATVWVNPAPVAAAPKPAPKPVTTTAVRRKPVAVAGPAPSPATPAPKDWSNPPATTAASTPAPAPAARTQDGGCSNASAFSQQFINKKGGRFAVRCGPQTEAPVSYVNPGESHSTLAAPAATSPSVPYVAQPSGGVQPGTRVVARHVYDKRRNTTNVVVPQGYRSVWKDDRLNPHRAERTLAPAQVQGVVTVPRGYKLVDWEDNRLNLRRGVRTAAGEAQSDQIWNQTVPRTPVALRVNGVIVTVPKGSARAQDEESRAKYSPFARLSTRSAPAPVVARAATAPAPAGQKPSYVRVATYSGDAQARSAAQSLARSGLPVRLGTLKPSGRRVVLAGPYSTRAQANAALNRLRGAGYSGAKLSN